MIQVSDEVIWKWYQILEDYKKGDNITGALYCHHNNLNYKEFSNMKYRIIFKRDSDPEGYKKLMAIVEKFYKSGLSIRSFANEHKVERSALTAVTVHMQYLEIIERLVKEKGGKPMEFVQVLRANIPAPEPIHQPEPTPIHQLRNYENVIPSHSEPSEVIEPRNDIEINITKGVKVIISPNVDSMKIIKIIELLKDL